MSVAATVVGSAAGWVPDSVAVSAAVSVVE